MPYAADDTRPDRSFGDATRYREIETKFDVAPDYVVPDMDKLARKDDDWQVDQVDVSSTYYDTAALELLRFRLTLRNRAGQADTGWQLKVPGAGYRTELHWPGEPNSLPTELLHRLRPFLDGADPEAALRLDTDRIRHRLVDRSGELLVEIAQDDVRATGLGVSVRAARWHEVEAELGPAGDRKLLARVGTALSKAGAVSSTSRSKLARAVLGIGNESVGSPRESAGAVLLDYISDQVDAIVSGHFAIHDDLEDSVHQTRVACRRLRSTLRNFQHCFDSEAATRLENELQWYAQLLGEVRDREVLRVRLADAIAALPPELVIGPVAERIDARLVAELSVKRADILATHEGGRYAQLLASVAGWRADPLFTAAAGRPAHTLSKPLKRAEKILAKRLEAAVSANGSDADMHRARKAGKRARYAAEAVEQENSPRVKQGKQLQDLLGEFQDSVVGAELVQRLALEARERGEDGFTYGVLLAEQRANAERAKALVRGL